MSSWCHGVSWCHGNFDTYNRYFDKAHFEINQKSLRLPVLLFVTRTAHDVLEYQSEFSLESVQ